MNQTDEILSIEFDRLVCMAETYIRANIKAYGKKAKGSFTIGTSLTGDTEYADIPCRLEETETIMSVIDESGIDEDSMLRAFKKTSKEYDVFVLEHHNKSYLAFQFYDTWFGCFKLKTAKLFIKKLEESLSDTKVKFTIKKEGCCTEIRIKYHSV